MYGGAGGGGLCRRGALGGGTSYSTPAAQLRAHPYTPPALPPTHLRLRDEQVEVEPGGGAGGQHGRRRGAGRVDEVVALAARPRRGVGRREDVGD